ncbi:hypothetical protein GSI_08936 [Ganoderma sinense ZZ0214-1]|uniref:BAH domain-containing protein n=1 Tax=Ganoderma sinense ZZ0214-1 TaxID=1077348 RepID=A0A2G8S544_9APHY|nr:hypothetical protein GSI_08936 [Ganoderma sinense ZZ0214-1]
MSKSRHAQGHGRQSRMAKCARKTDDGLYLRKDAEDIEFESMDRRYAFNVDVLETDTSDPRGFTYQNRVFKIGDDVILNSKFDDTNDIWLGQINQIRTSKDKTKTLAKVRWYWSRNDVATIMKSFDHTKCSPYERILSDDYDYVSPYAFQARAHVYEYHEDDLNPPPIGPTSFFIRTTLLHRKKQIKPPLGHDTCHCKEAYNPYPAPVLTNPDDMTSSPSEPPDTMHFCPSVNCRKWFHARCLALMQNLDTTSHPMTRAIRLLANDPDSQAPFVMFGHFAGPESREIVPDSTQQMTVNEALEFWTRERTILAHLPPALLAIAQAPIVRRSGVPGGWAIGNVADVVLARRFVYAALEHDGAPERSAKFLELLRRDAARWEDVIWLERRRQGGPSHGDVETMDVDMDSGADTQRADLPVELEAKGLGRWGSSTRTAAATASATPMEVWGGLWDGVNLQEDSDCGEEEDGGAEETLTASGSPGKGKSRSADREPDEISALEALCEDLGQFELLASPYGPYWERRGREFEEAAAAGLLDGPDFVCPQCRSAI